MPNQPTSSDRKPQDKDTRDREAQEGSARNEEKRDRDTDTQRSKDRDDRQATDRDRGEGGLGRDSKSYSREARDRDDEEKGDRRRDDRNDGDSDGGSRGARNRERDTGAGGNAATPNPVQIQKYLGGLDYPVDKEDLLDQARAQGADERVMEALERIPEGRYDSPIAVSQEVSRLE